MATDRFTIPLLCPSCSKSGEAQCWQENGWAYMKGKTSTSVTKISPGFSRVEKRSRWGEDINFVCDECDELSASK